MTRRILAATLAGLAVFGLTLMADGVLSGTTSFWMELDPLVGIDVFDLGAELTYTLGDAAFATDSLIVLPALWVWQGFAAVWTPRAFDIEANVLFGASTADFLYVEWIWSLSFGALGVEVHAAHLGSAVLGGPADGWAVRATGTVGPFDITSNTEFGAKIEDDDNGGITIVHAVTGLERHYSTDPRIPGGQGFTGQRVTLGLFDFCCTDRIEAEICFTSAGFEYLSFAATQITVPELPWLRVDAEIVFELETKSLTVAPSLVLGEILCFTLYAGLDSPSSTVISAFEFYGIELICELGPVTVREVSLFDLNEYVLTTEAYGSRVTLVREALDNGWDYYPEYWEMLSIAYAGPSCCEGEATFLANIYFDAASTYLFDWAMMHVEAEIPFSELISIMLALKVTGAGAEMFGFGFDITW